LLGLLPVLLVFSSVAPTAAPPPRFTTAFLGQLLIEYQKHGLPLPPRDAKLVRYLSDPSFVCNGKLTEPGYSLAFLVGQEGGRPLVMHGMYTTPISRSGPQPKVVVPTGAEAKKARSGGRHETLLFAVQAYSFGWTGLALEVLTRVQERGGQVSLPALRKEAWDYWAWELPSQQSDWREIARRLKTLRAADKALDQEYHRSLIKSLDAALVPSKAKPGSVEALIDQFITSRSDATYERLAGLGFKAVPALIDHLEDRRLTRHVKLGFNNFPSWHKRVQDVVSDLLQTISGEEFDRDWLRRQQGYPVKKPDAVKWWEGAKKIGEEAYALRRLFPKEGDGIDGHQLRAIRERYPRHLPRLYRRVLEGRPRTQSWGLAEAIAESSLPLKKKLVLLHAGAMGKNLMHRREALYQLLNLDRPFFVWVVGETLRKLPRDTADEYWKCEEAHVARFVALAGEPALWELLEEAARPASIGLRMELLNQSYPDKETPTCRRRRLYLLAAFLDDAASRDEEADKRYQGPGAGFHYRVLSVRDFAADVMASYLDIKVPLNPELTPKEWEKIRQQVRAAWERECASAKPNSPPK
jgi:hypothetical protein